METTATPLPLLLPQQAPFRMVDELLYSDSSKSITKFFIKEDNVLCREGVFLETGMIENIAQTVAAGRGYQGSINQEPIKIGYIGSIKNFKLLFNPPVNSEIFTEIYIESQVLNFTSVTGKILYNGKVAALCELVVAVQE